MWAIEKELAQNNYKLKTKESDWGFMFEFGKGKLSGQMLNKNIQIQHHEPHFSIEFQIGTLIPEIVEYRFSPEEGYYIELKNNKKQTCEQIAEYWLLKINEEAYRIF